MQPRVTAIFTFENLYLTTRAGLFLNLFAKTEVLKPRQFFPFGQEVKALFTTRAARGQMTLCHFKTFSFFCLFHRRHQLSWSACA